MLTQLLALTACIVGTSIAAYWSKPWSQVPFVAVLTNIYAMDEYWVYYCFYRAWLAYCWGYRWRRFRTWLGCPVRQPALLGSIGASVTVGQPWRRHSGPAGVTAIFTGINFRCGACRGCRFWQSVMPEVYALAH